MRDFARIFRRLVMAEHGGRAIRDSIEIKKPIGQLDRAPPRVNHGIEVGEWYSTCIVNRCWC
jgi:hypothetical protein